MNDIYYDCVRNIFYIDGKPLAFILGNNIYTPAGVFYKIRDEIGMGYKHSPMAFALNHTRDYFASLT